MKFTLSWLREHLETDASLAEITDRLTAIGLELESLTDPGATLAAFRVAHVLEAVPHPNADRLRVCTVNTGAGVVSVVCGAPNARTGMKAVFAPPGSVIPASGATLKTGDIRGVASAGMLLSRREMGLGEEHDGILELPAEAPVGTPYPVFAGLDDPVIDIAVTPNRGDALGVRGVARDLAAAGLGVLKPWAAPAIVASGETPLRWRLDWPEACPWIIGRAVRGVRNGASPAWLAARLAAIGLRPISALVDITNFFAIDLGRPLHVFDLAKLQGDLAVRRGAGETLRGLDGRDHLLSGEDCVIADAAGVQSVGGVIGGAASGCDDATTDVFIECALFDPVRVALTGRRLGVSTDARQRFERGIDAALLPDALEAATAMVVRLCGGTPAPVTAAGACPPWQRVASLRFARLDAMAGEPIPPQQVVETLTRLGFAVAERDDASVTLRVPSWRNDIAARRTLHPAPGLAPERLAAAIEGCDEMEPEADLIEEVLRLRGLDSLPATPLPMPHAVPAASLTPRQTRANLARRVLAARGLAECVTFSFADDALAAAFGGPDAPRLANPIAADLSSMRPTPLATLTLAARRNVARGETDVALFEIGPGFSGSEAAAQHRLAAGLRAGASPRSWIEPSRAVDAFDAKADVLEVLAALGVAAESLGVVAEAPPHYHPGRSGSVRQGPRLTLATFGALHPALTEAYDLPRDAVGFEIMLDAISDPRRRRKAAPDLPDLMPLHRDFAFVVGPDVSAEQLLRAARGADRTLVSAATLFDVYAMEDDRLSLGVEVTLQPRERTLTDAEIEAACARIVAAVGKTTGGVLR